MQEPEYKMLVLSYPDNGYSREELDLFIKAIHAFDEEAKEQYKGESVRYFFLPEGMVAEMGDKMEANNVSK